MPALGSYYAHDPSASILRRSLALPYELLLLLPVGMLAGSLFPGTLDSNEMHILNRHLFQGTLSVTFCIYFMICWRIGGQTLPMKTWKVRVVNEQGAQLGARQSLFRFLLAFISIGTAGIGVLWAYWDPDRQFLHDRLARTRLVATVY